MIAGSLGFPGGAWWELEGRSTSLCGPFEPAGVHFVSREDSLGAPWLALGALLGPL